MIFEGVEKALEPQTFTSPKVSQNHYLANVSELFGIVSALRRNANQTEAATNMGAIHKQNQIFTTL